MTCKDFVESELERASQNEWFDKNGNNVVATSNRSFIAELKLQISGFNSDIMNSVDLKELMAHVLSVIMLLSLPITYIPFLLLRTFFTRRRANKEMLESYNKTLNAKNG